MEKELKGWNKILDGHPWFSCEGCFPLPAYSEFMPSPLVGQKPLGDIDYRILDESDKYVWKISEMEEEFELHPGIKHIGQQIVDALIRLGKGLTEHHIHGHEGENLRDNPYWPPELASKAGKLEHERYVILLPMMLSRTQDDKGRIIWTFFGNSVHEPEQAFWKSFYSSPGIEKPAGDFITFFGSIINKAYGLQINDDNSLFEAGFRILSSHNSQTLNWVRKFTINEDSSFADTKFLLTFRPFSSLPEIVKERYLSSRLNLIPFPGSLVFWGMPGYNKMKTDFTSAEQIPLLNIVARNRGLGGLKVPQAGWFREPHPDNEKHEINEVLLHNSFHRTNRWERVHRYQDELNETTGMADLVKTLFSTETEAMGLYDKPLARNTHIWNHRFDLILDGPNASSLQIAEAEKTILSGGLFGYRFFYPPMRAGKYSIFWHRPLVAYISFENDSVEICPGLLPGYFTGYNTDDSNMTCPVELWPVIIKRPVYLSAVSDFTGKNDHFSHQTSLNIISLFEAWKMQDERSLSQSFAQSLLCIAKNKTFNQWLWELPSHSDSPEPGLRMQSEIHKIVEPADNNRLTESSTYSLTATRSFEEDWWNDIKVLAHGEFITKDNADVVNDEATLRRIIKHKRDLDKVGDYLLERHRKTIADNGMDGIAFCGELPFRWETDFDFSVFGGWKGNMDGSHYERNILVVIPGKNRKEAVIMGDHYDTAFMEDIYEKSRGGSGARLAANGADDNYSATSTILQAAPIFLKMSREEKLERDIWLIHLTGEEFPSDCMGARNFCRSLIEKTIKLKIGDDIHLNLSDTTVKGVFIMDMIGHNRDNDQDVFQISPGKSPASLFLARQAHIANKTWNDLSAEWNKSPERADKKHGKRISGTETIPELARFLKLSGEVRTQFNPYSSIFNTDGQIFSDVGLPVVLFMENYDINRTGYHDTKDTMENIDLDYGSAFAAIAIETVARVASLTKT